jgi:hypothetical protein
LESFEDKLFTTKQKKHFSDENESEDEEEESSCESTSSSDVGNTSTRKTKKPVNPLDDSDSEMENRKPENSRKRKLEFGSQENDTR